MARLPALLSPVLVLFSCDLVRANRPPSPVNVTVTQLKANSATVSWDVPEGDVVIGYAILQQRQDGQMQRFIREVNTTNRACVLWDLAEDADYIIQVQSIGLYGESQASKRVHFRTLKETDRLPSNSSNQGLGGRVSAASPAACSSPQATSPWKGWTRTGSCRRARLSSLWLCCSCGQR
ncbi:fibronectin type III domain-containing protein 4 isoform X5 [Dromaius novaehollandiae]|uniref:fibronectin type III domain-containing protein 4 isoform X5 n=1 Tax=Dromaius novaehollandiae TaxID=8790 RepID=UPI00311F5307